VVAAKKDQAEASRARTEQRSSLLKNILLIPFNLGIPLLRQFFNPSKRRS
jgi:hypothetical protein